MLLPYTVMCLSIWTPKNRFSMAVSNVKLISFRYPKIWAHYSLIIVCINNGTPKNCHKGTPKNHYFPFWTSGKVVVLCVPILSTLVYVQAFQLFSLPSHHHKKKRVASSAYIYVLDFRKYNVIHAHLMLASIFTVIILNIGTDMSEQTVQTQIRLLLMEQSD